MAVVAQTCARLDVSRFRSDKKLLRVTAWILRFKKNCTQSRCLSHSSAEQLYHRADRSGVPPLNRGIARSGSELDGQTEGYAVFSVYVPIAVPGGNATRIRVTGRDRGR